MDVFVFMAMVELYNKDDHRWSSLAFNFPNLFTEVVAQFSADGGMPQAAERLSLDLADALARDAHLAPDFLKSVGLSIEQAIA